MTRTFRLLPALASLALVAAAGAPALAAPADVKPTEDEKLLIGEHPLAEERGVIDGDTIRVDGVKNSLRLLFIDTEETPKPGRDDEELLALMESDFDAYVKKVSEGHRLPVKYGTPLGVEATEWASAFFADAKAIRLELDAPGPNTDNYGRVLCLVWAVFGDERAPRLYNLEAVRAGMSPYFNKYGRSRRYDAEFRAAEQEAKEKKLGIWDPAKEHYPDYEARLAWWARRAEALTRYDALASKGDAPILLGTSKGITRLKKVMKAGDEAWVFGLIDDHNDESIKLDGAVATVLVGSPEPIEVVIEGKELIASLDLESLRGEFLAVRGPVDKKGSAFKKWGRQLKYYRVVVTEAEQVVRGHELKTP